MADAAERPGIYVLAGPNGAGKSSVAGAMFRASGSEYFNPDEAARRILKASPQTTLPQANGLAWHEGKRLLERAIAEKLAYAFETTLGGRTIPALLQRALSAGCPVRMWYVGLDSPERHIARVRARVARGGHDIADALVRARYDRSRLNLMALMPGLTELRLYDNSAEADPASGIAPRPLLILHLAQGTIVRSCALARVPEWAKPLVVHAVG